MEMQETDGARTLDRETYEPPALIEVGGFADKTMGAGSAYPEGQFAHILNG